MSTDPMRALRTAQQARLQRADLIRHVHAGNVPLRDALEHPAAQTALAFDFLSAARFSKHRASKRQRSMLRRFDRHRIPAWLTVSELSVVQRDTLCDELTLKRPRISRAKPRLVVAPPDASDALDDGAPVKDVRLPQLPGRPLGEAMRAYARRTGRPLTCSMEWCGSSDKAITRWAKGGRVDYETAERALAWTDLLWWDVWPPDEYPEVAAIFDPEAVAA